MNQFVPAILLLFTFGCTAYRHAIPLDPDRILGMAGEEAGQIASAKERLTRQLNIVNRQNQNNHPQDARKTLALAKITLEQAAPATFTDQERLAGWISLSELARNADDLPFASNALDHALTALNTLNPQPNRCEYVLGIEQEIRQLRGDPQAAAFLLTAAEWALDLPAPAVRKTALFAFTTETFNCNDYQTARTILRKENDPTWRSDALTIIADRASFDRQYKSAPSATLAGRSSSQLYTPAEGPPLSEATFKTAFPTTFGKQLDFRSNFYREK